MNESGAAAAYLELLEGVAARVDRIGPRVIASHWPFVGTDYRGLLVVGQALAGWDDKSSSALWRASAAATAAGRREILANTQSWARKHAEPLDEPLRTQRGKPFWDLSRRFVGLLEPDGDSPWYARYGWWNLFPLGWGDTNQSPSDALWMPQLATVPRLFWEVVEMLAPSRVIVLAGKAYWDNMAEPLGLSDLPRLRLPLIAGGRRDGRTFLWTYHPGAHIKGLNRQQFAITIADAIRQIEGERQGTDI